MSFEKFIDEVSAIGRRLLQNTSNQHVQPPEHAARLEEKHTASQVVMYDADGDELHVSESKEKITGFIPGTGYVHATKHKRSIRFIIK